MFFCFAKGSRHEGLSTRCSKGQTHLVFVLGMQSATGMIFGTPDAQKLRASGDLRPSEPPSTIDAVFPEDPGSRAYPFMCHVFMRLRFALDGP